MLTGNSVSVLDVVCVVAATVEKRTAFLSLFLGSLLLVLLLPGANDVFEESFGRVGVDSVDLQTAASKFGCCINFAENEELLILTRSGLGVAAETSFTEEVDTTGPVVAVATNGGGGGISAAVAQGTDA